MDSALSHAGVARRVNLDCGPDATANHHTSSRTATTASASRWPAVALNVTDRATHLVGMIEKHFPTAATRPHRMIHWTMYGAAQLSAARFLQLLHHLLGEMLVLPNQNVYVIWHDGARIARVSLFFDHMREHLANYRSRRRIERQQRMAEHLRRLRIELANGLPARLRLFASVMQRAELRKDVITNKMRSTPARVVGEPPPIRRPDQMVRNHNGLSHCVTSVAASRLSATLARCASPSR